MKNFTEIFERGLQKTTKQDIAADTVNNTEDYDTVKEIVNDTETHYVSDYGDSSRLLDVLIECGLLEKDKSDGGTLYNSGWQGVLTYWLRFSDVVPLCKFLVAFDKYAEKFNYDKVHDGQWHMSFDSHDDPLTGVDNKTVTYILRYNSKTTQLDEIDKAIDDLCETIKKQWSNYPNK